MSYHFLPGILLLLCSICKQYGGLYSYNCRSVAVLPLRSACRSCTELCMLSAAGATKGLWQTVTATAAARGSSTTLCVVPTTYSTSLHAMPAAWLPASSNPELARLARTSLRPLWQQSPPLTAHLLKRVPLYMSELSSTHRCDIVDC